jgi:hypothetical protein
MSRGGNVTLTGPFSQTIDFGTPLTSLGLDDVFLASIGP